MLRCENATLFHNCDLTVDERLQTHILIIILIYSSNIFQQAIVEHV